MNNKRNDRRANRIQNVGIHKKRKYTDKKTNKGNEYNM